MTDELRIVPASQVSAAQLQTVMGSRGDAHHCQCQWFLLRDKDYTPMPREQRMARLTEQTGCGTGGEHSSGLVALLGDEPVGWVAVEPRSHYARLARTRVPWAGRHEDPSDDGVWCVVCFVVRTGFRRRGIGAALAQAAVEYARVRGARAVEGYPKQLAPGSDATWGELFVGTPSMFASAGLTEVSHPTPRRLVMRRDFV